MRLAAPLLAILLAKVTVTYVEAIFPQRGPYQLDCFSKKGLAGELISVMSSIEDTKNDTQKFNFNISSCLVTGIWLVYDRPGFQGNLNAISGENKAFTPSLHENISSIRKIGNMDTRSNELVLFQETWFQKSEAWTVSGKKEFFQKGKVIKSAIVKGFWDWTIIGTNDSSVCLKANKNGAAFFGQIDGDKGFGPVKSVNLGCKGRILVGEDQILEESDCRCNVNGVLHGYTRCEYKNASCICDSTKGYVGQKCYDCIDGFFAVNQTCQKCKCNVYGVKDGDTTCQPSGTCTCDAGNGYSGTKCDQCVKGFYKDGNVCKKCGCHMVGVLGGKGGGNIGCDDSTGQCKCDASKGYIGIKCDKCKRDEFYRLDEECIECGCNTNGIVTGECDKSGVCQSCDTSKGYTGNKCKDCLPGFYNSDSTTCQPCNCNTGGVLGGNTKCSGSDGKCTCNTDVKHFTGVKCDKCSYGFHKNGASCQACKCNTYGVQSDKFSCDDSGECTCDTAKGYKGKKCDQCDPSKNVYQVGYECKACGCDTSRVADPSDLSCDAKGQCTCDDLKNYGGRDCKGCHHFYYLDTNNIDCIDCNCNPLGSSKCIDKNTCQCQWDYQGPKCNDVKVRTISFGQMSNSKWKIHRFRCHTNCVVQEITATATPIAKLRVHAQAGTNMQYRDVKANAFCGGESGVSGNQACEFSTASQKNSPLSKSEIAVAVGYDDGSTAQVTLKVKIGNFRSENNLNQGTGFT